MTSPGGDEDVAAALETLPDAGTLIGDPGHDQALGAARGAALLRDRALGFTYDQMAERHGYADGSGARQALLRALIRHEAHNARDLRIIENERYELDQLRLRTMIGDTSLPPVTRIKAIDARTRAAARHARLNGLDAPVQVEVSAAAQAAVDEAIAQVQEVVGEVVSLRIVPDHEELGDEIPEEA